jgi:two-component system, OmpR family, KDP operon response regulator KdpE
MNATRVLVVEDDPNIVDLVRSNLLVRGFEVEIATTGAVVLDLVASYDPEIVLLDLMLPDADGFDICRDLRQRYDVGLIVVSARTAEQDKVRALNLGADDYLTKPFGIEELMARMTATLRRSRIAESPEPVGDILLGDIRVGLEAKAVFKGGERVQLTPTEFSLLRYLALNAGSLLSYEQLLREVWGRGYENSREYVRVYVGRLRSKLEDENGPALIVTEPRAGYRLVIPD